MSGVVAQYPISRTRAVRTLKNVLADGGLVLYQDAGAGKLVWNLEYTELSDVDLALLQAHFAACMGPYHAFTFLDPTGNLLAWSSDLTQPLWGAPASLAIAAGIADPDGGMAAFSFTNNGQVPQGIEQNLPIPAAYQYVFSVYAESPVGAAVTLSRTGQSGSSSKTFTVGANWQRISINGTLEDSANTFSVGLSVNPGQQLNVYAPQLEPQIASSRPRLTAQQGGVYANAHWGVNSIPVIATAPGLFATSFTIEAAV
jgi:hypothetical protein